LVAKIARKIALFLVTVHHGSVLDLDSRSPLPNPPRARAHGGSRRVSVGVALKSTCLGDL
jgi:hypothetical protein